MKDIKNFILESSQDDLEDMTSDLSSWWNENINDDGYDSRRAYREDMEAMADGANDPLVDQAFDYLESQGWNPKDIERWEEDLVAVLVQWANDALEDL